MDINYKALSTTELNHIVLSDCTTRKIFKGTFSADMLPTKFELPAGFIINTDTSKFEGQHWIGVFINKDKSAEYFDSFGLEPYVKEHKEFLKKHSTKYIYNKQALQSLFSSVCGQYVVLYLGAKARGISLPTFIKKFHKNDYFSNDALTILAFRKHFLHRKSNSCNHKKCEKKMICLPKHFCCSRNV